MSQLELQNNLSKTLSEAPSRGMELGRRPEIPSWDWEPKRSWWRSILEHAKRLSVACSDRFSAAERRLKTHLVLCGFPRSGTSLMQAMAETAVTGANVFGFEMRALRVATRMRRKYLKQPLLITKRTNDIFYIDDIRAFYSANQVDVKFVVLIRDPRDVLTSFHSSKPNEYYLSPERWRSLYEHYLYVRDQHDVLVVRYEDLVRDPDAIQERLSTLMNWELKQSFRDFHKSVPEGFEVRGLNGIRPVDTKSIGRWKQSQHRERMIDMLLVLPELPSAIVEMGYEKDAAWVHDYAIADHQN